MTTFQVFFLHLGLILFENWQINIFAPKFSISHLLGVDKLCTCVQYVQKTIFFQINVQGEKLCMPTDTDYISFCM